MSGWIKVEKDLATDPRVIRMAKALDAHLANSCVCDPCNAHALPGVTLVVGALTRLWIYADSHARDDDSLDLGTSEIDELLGIPGFCSLMPADWLAVIDERTVELPGFQEHNNVEAKSRALTQKRVERHRTKTKRETVTARNATPLPDQTRPDQTKTRQIHERAQEPIRTRDLTPAPAPLTRAHAFDDVELMDAFAVVRSSYPKFAGRQDWPNAEHHWRMRVEDGTTPQELLAGVERYAAFVAAGGASGSAFVITPGKFFGGADKPWSQAWTPPASTKPAPRIRTATDIAEEYEARAAAGGSQ